MNSWKVTGFWFMLVLWLSAGAAPQPALFGVQATRAARSRPLRLESFLPTDALAVALVDNVAGLKAALSQTEFYRLASEKSPGDPAAKSFRETVDSMSGRGLRAALVAVAPSTTGRRLSMALIIQGRTGAAIKTGAVKIEDAYKVIAADPTPATPFMMATTSSQVDGEAVSFARRDNLFIFGQQTAVEKVAGTRSEASLSSDPIFQRAREQRPADEVIFTSVNFKPLISYITQALLSQQRDGGDMLQMLVPAIQLAGGSALQRAHLSTRFQQGRAVEQTSVLINWARAGLLPAVFAFPPIHSKGAQWLPPETSAYGSFGIDPLQIYDALLKAFGPLIALQFGGASIDESIKGLESRIGFRIRDELLAALGSELVIAQVKANIVTLIEVKQPDLLKTVLEKRQADQANESGAATVETYKGKQIYPLADKFSVSLIGPLEALADADDIKRLIDQVEQGQFLASTEGHKRAFGGGASPRGIEFLVTSDVLNHPQARRVLGGGNGSSPSGEALRAGFHPMFYGVGGRNSEGLTAEITSPIGTVLVWDFLQTAWGPETTRLTGRAGSGSSLLQLIAYFSQAFRSGQ